MRTVTEETPLLVDYFLERHLVDWLAAQGEAAPVCAGELIQCVLRLAKATGPNLS